MKKIQVKPDWANIPEGENGIDIECVNLCEVMNQFSGIETVESCCGHGEKEFRIWFLADNLEVLPPVLYYFDGCHCGFYGWNVIVSTDCAMSPVKFMVEGPIGESAYIQANAIALIMRKWLEEQKCKS